MQTNSITPIRIGDNILDDVDDDRREVMNLQQIEVILLN